MIRFYGLILVFAIFVFHDDGIARQFGNYVSTTELEQQLETSIGDDRIRLLLRLSSRFDRSDISKSGELAQEALSLSSAFDSDSLAAESNLQLGYISLLGEKSVEALEYYSTAKEIFNDFGIKLREGVTLARIGQLYSELGQYPESLLHYYEALAIFRENEGVQGELDVLLRISMVMSDRKDYESALNFAEQTISLAEESGNKLGLTMALSQAAALERQQNNTEKAISYYERAMHELEAMGSTHGAVSIMLDLSDLYEKKEAYSEVFSLNNEVYTFAKSSQNNVLLIESMFNFSRILHFQGNYEVSNDTLFSALEIIDESGLKIMQSMFQLLISENYLELENPKQAIFFSEQARESAKEQGDLSLEEDALQTMIRSYIAEENYTGAFEAQKDLMAIRDSIYTRQNEEQIARMQARYEISEKEKEIKLLESENDQKEIIQAFLGIGFLLVLIAAFFIVRSQRLKILRSKAELEVSKLKSLELERNLEFKNKQLTSQSLNMVQKNEMMEEIKQKVETLKERGSSRELNSLSQLVDYSATLDEDWKQFQMHFEEVHSGFYHILKDRYSNLTPNEMRLSALVKLNLTIKEMAAILGISPDSVKTARYRLRKKLDLNTEDNLTEFMLQLEKESLEVG